MPLRIVRSATSARLWEACLDGWLDALGDSAEPDSHAARLWLAHRTQRDAALEAAAARGLAGWFDPPLHFLSELRSLFDIPSRPIGVLTGRLLVARLARERGDEAGLPAYAGDAGPARSHMLDGLFGELLAEGVSPAELAAALGGLPADEFTRARNAWIRSTYADFLEALRTRNLFDARQIHALVAERVEAGELAAAVRGARELHVYGPTSLTRRERLVRAFASQDEVDVRMYVIREPEPSEWERVVGEAGMVELDGPEAGEPRVRPVPDALREASYVARQVKERIVKDGCAPREIAIVARSGRQDTRRLHRALADAGVPATARLRSPLAEIPALRALLELFRGQASGWDYRTLRFVGTSPYFGLGLDPRPLDYLSGERRISGLDAWGEALEDLRSVFDGPAPGRSAARRGRMLRARGLATHRVAAAGEALASLAGHARELGSDRPESAWIDYTRRLTAGDAFQFRRRACRVVGERHDVVRLDQRGIRALDGLLSEWRELVGEGPLLSAGEWHGRLRRLLEANELALSTPMQEGVQVLEAHEAALTPFRHVFVVHANDGEFPRSPRGAGIFSDGERRRLREAGLPLEDRALALRRERALWRSVTAAPDVAVTYRSATAAGAPLLPSLMVPRHDPASALPRTAVHEPGEGEPYSLAEQLRRDVLRVGRARRGDEREALTVANPHAVRHAVLAAFAEELRSGAFDDVAGIEDRLRLEPAALLGRDRPVSERAHAWGGRLRDPVVLDALARRFGGEHVWSASQLEQYARRPFDFFLARFLGIEGREEAEEELSPLASGNVIHAVLEALHRRLLDADSDAFKRGPELVDEVCAEVFEACEREAELWLGLPSLWRLEREHLRTGIAQFVEWDFRRFGRLDARPIAVEFAFGDGDAPPAALAGRDTAGRPATLRLRGRIDRVERSARAGGGVRVVDYKRNATPATAGYDDGAVLQAALYMRAWERLHGEAPREGLYLSVLDPGAGSRSGLPAERVEAVLRLALSVPARVLSGLFEPVQAASAHPPSPWQPGPEVTRTNAGISAGTRFDNPAEGSGNG